MEGFLIFVSAVSGFASISAFASLFTVLVGIAISAVGMKICALTAWIKNSSQSKKNKKTRNNIVLLAKAKLYIIEFLVSNALIDSYINHNEVVSINNVLREYNKTKREIKNPETSVEYFYMNMVDVSRETYEINQRKVWNKWCGNNSRY